MILCIGHLTKFVQKWSRTYILIGIAIVANVEMARAEKDGAGNNIGYNFRPVYALKPHVDLVAQYTLMMGDGACKLGAHRYIRAQTTAPTYVDSLHSFYLGANFYYSAKNNLMKSYISIYFEEVSIQNFFT